METTSAIAKDIECAGGQWDALGGGARVWIHVADRPLTEVEEERLTDFLEAFVGSWSAHQVPLKSGWKLWGRRVLIIGVDESVEPASGCSIDSMTHALQQVGAELGVDWFNRMQVLHEDEEGEWACTPMHAFWALRKAGRVDDSILVVNPLAKTKAEWESSGIQPFGDSWHASMWR